MARPSRPRDRRFPQARKVIPKEVRAILGRTEFKQALRGPTSAEIRQECAALVAGWEAQISAARAELAGEVVTLTPRQVAELAGDHYRAEVAFWQDQHSDPDDWSGAVDHLLEQEKPGAQQRAAAQDLLRSRGIAADRASVERLAEAVYVQSARAYQLLQRRADGDWGADRHLDTLPAGGPAEVPTGPRSEPVVFSSVVDRHAAEADVPKKTREKWQAAFRNLAATVGHDDLRRLTKEDVRKWKEARLATGIAHRTVVDNIGVCRSSYNWGLKNGLLPDGPNPFSGMAPKVSKRGLSARDPFSDDDAQAILTAARGETGWLRWLPFVLAYTGARLEEATDARARDVRQEGGVWVLDVVPTAERKLKNEQSRRMIPLHPALVAEGFVAYAASVPTDGPLFPTLKRGRYGLRADIATKALSRWVRGTVGITDKRKAPAHSWRHRMEDALRFARVAEEAQDAITGHDNPRNAGAGYGRGFRRMPGEVLKEMEKLPAIPLPVVSRSQKPRT